MGAESEEEQSGQRPSLEDRIRSNMDRSALRREALRLARAERRRQKKPRVEILQTSAAAEESQNNIMTDLYNINDLVALERERETKQKDTNRAERAALKLEKEIARLNARMGHRDKATAGTADAAAAATTGPVTRVKSPSLHWDAEEDKKTFALLAKCTQRRTNQKRKKVEKKTKRTVKYSIANVVAAATAAASAGAFVRSGRGALRRGRKSATSIRGKEERRSEVPADGDGDGEGDDDGDSGGGASEDDTSASGMEASDSGSSADSTPSSGDGTRAYKRRRRKNNARGRKRSGSHQRCKQKKRRPSSSHGKHLRTSRASRPSFSKQQQQQRQQQQQQLQGQLISSQQHEPRSTVPSKMTLRHKRDGVAGAEAEYRDRDEGADENGGEERQQRGDVVLPLGSSFKESSIRSSTVDLGDCSSIDLGAGATSSVDLEQRSRDRGSPSRPATAAAPAPGNNVAGAQSKNGCRSEDRDGGMAKASQGPDPGICENDKCAGKSCSGNGTCVQRCAGTPARPDAGDGSGVGGGVLFGYSAKDGVRADASSAGATGADVGVADVDAAAADGGAAGASRQDSPSGFDHSAKREYGDQRRSTRDGSHPRADSNGKHDRGYRGNSSVRSSSAMTNGGRDRAVSSAGGRRIRSTAGGKAVSASGVGDRMPSLESLRRQNRSKNSGDDEPLQQQGRLSAARRRKAVLFESSVDEQEVADVARQVARERKRRRARRARHRQMLNMRSSISRRGQRMMAAMAPVEYAGGECTEVALDLDRGNIHVYRSVGGGRRGKHLSVPLSKVSASVAKRNPKLVVLRLSGRHLATIGQGAWREVSGQGAAYRKRVKAFRGTSSSNNASNVSPSASALAAVALADWGEELDVGTADCDATFATESFSMRARHRSANRSSPPSRAPSAARRFFGRGVPAVGGSSDGGDGGGAPSALGNPCSSVGFDASFESPSTCGTMPFDDWPGTAPTKREPTGVENQDEMVEVYGSGGGSRSNSSPRPTPPACAAPSSRTKPWRFITRPGEESTRSAFPTWMPSKSSERRSGETPSGLGEQGQGRAFTPSPLPTASLDKYQRGVDDAGKDGGIGDGTAPATPTQTAGIDGGERKERGNMTAFTALRSAFGKTRSPGAVTTATSSNASVPCGQDGRGSSNDGGHRPVSFERPTAAVAEHLDPREFVEGRDRQPDPRSLTTIATAAAAARAAGAAGAAGEAPGSIPATGSVAAPKPWTLINKIGPKTIMSSTRAPYSGHADRPHEPANRSKTTAGLRRAQGATTAKEPNRHGIPTVPEGGGGGGGGGRVRGRWHLVNAETNAVKACRRARTWATASAGRQAVRQRWGGLKSARQTTSIFMRGLTAVSDDVDDDVDAPSSDDAGSGEECGGRSDESSSIWCESRGDSGEYSSSYGSVPSRAGDFGGDGRNSFDWQRDIDSSNSGDGSTMTSGTSTSSSSSSSKVSSSSSIVSSSSSTSTSGSSRSETDDVVPPQLPGRKRHGGHGSKTFRRTNVMPRANTIGKMFFTGSIVFAGLQHRVQEELAKLFVKEVPRVDVRIVADIASTIQTIQIMPPSLLVVAWAAFGSAKLARDFLGDGARGVRGVKSGLPVAVVVGESDGEGLRITLEAMGASAVLLWPYKAEDVKDVLNTHLHIRR